MRRPPLMFAWQSLVGYAIFLAGALGLLVGNAIESLLVFNTSLIVCLLVFAALSLWKSWHWMNRHESEFRGRHE